MNHRMMIVAFAALLAVTAAAVVVGSASADSDATVYGSDVQPYAGIDATYDELDDGAIYYIVKGGSVSISFAGIEASGMETDLAGSGLTTDYVDERIHGTLQKSATVTIGDKTIRLDVSESATTLPVYGREYVTVNDGKFTDAYIQKAYYASFTFSAYYSAGARNVSISSSPTEYGLTASVSKGSDTCTVTLSGTPTKGVDSFEVIILEFMTGVQGQNSKGYYHVITLTIKDTFTINYNATDGSCSKSSDTVKYGSTVTLPSATRTNYSFLGWYTQASGGTYRGTSNDTYDPIAHYTVDQSITFYAQWEEDTDPVSSITISGATSVKVGNSITLTARTYPDDAKDHRVNWYVNSGSSYVDITSTTDTTSGGTCTIKGLAKGTATIHAIAQDGSGVYEPCTITVTEEVTSYSFTLKYNANGGSGAPSSFSTTSTGTTYNASVSTVKPTWSGHIFLGWSTSASDTTADYVGGDMITLRSGSTTTLYAVWEEITTTWTLSFEANGGSGTPGKMTALEAGTSHTWTLPNTVPTLSGYTFAGWARSESSTVGAYQAGGEYVSYVQDAVLYAVWEVEKTGYEFHLIFDVGEGSGGPGTIDMTDDTTSKDMRIPDTEPTRAGYEFLGWGINAGTSNVTWVPGGTYTFSAGTTTLFAVWKQYTYVLTLYTTDESGDSKKVEGVGVGEVSVTIPSDYVPTRSGYTFDGWQTKDKTTTYQPGQVLKISGDISLYAKWVEKTSDVKPAVRFNVTSDETQSTTVELVAGDDGSYRLPEYTPTRDGYKFLGWADVDNATAAVWQTGAILDMSTPKTLQVYAVWKIESTTWTVEFNANNGVGAPDTISQAATSATEKMEFSIPATEPTRDGYTFQGWDDSKDASTVLISPSGGTYVATSKSTTLYAVWKLGAPETYTVIFNDNGGTGGPGKVQSVGATFEIPAVTPTRDGHVFAGWSWNHDGEEKVIVPGKDETITLTDKETNLYAKWNEITADSVFDVIFNLDGGSGANIVTKSTTSTRFTIPTDYTPTKADGSEFLGWSTTKNGEDRYQPGDTVDLTRAETVFYAVWKSSSPTAPTLKWELSVNGSTLTFDGSASENVKSWVWDFGDGSKSSEKSGTHTYDAAGTYTVKLTVYSSSGMSSVCTKNVVVTGGSDPVADRGIAFYLAIVLVAVMVIVIGARLAGVF